MPNSSRYAWCSIASISHSPRSLLWFARTVQYSALASFMATTYMAAGNTIADIVTTVRSMIGSIFTVCLSEGEGWMVIGLTLPELKTPPLGSRWPFLELVHLSRVRGFRCGRVVQCLLGVPEVWFFQPYAGTSSLRKRRPCRSIVVLSGQHWRTSSLCGGPDWLCEESSRSFGCAPRAGRCHCL